MVTVLNRFTKDLFHLTTKFRIFIPITMAWRSIGTDNADLIKQLGGKFYIIKSNTKVKNNKFN